MNDIYCNYCKVTLPIYKFSKNRKDKLNKSCDECRVKQKAVRERYKCEHNRQKNRCKECGGCGICEHNRQKILCKECGGSGICEHNKRKSQCKDCGGSQICEHNKRKSKCKDCRGSEICEHNRQKYLCKECGGSNICEHNKQKSTCKECVGSEICEHNKRKSTCKDCGGSQICEHNRLKHNCKDCGGSNICEHNRIKTACKECDPIGHLSHIVRNSVNKSLKDNKELSSKDYLGCNIEELKMHIENQFHEGMTWDNYGEWHIDHIIPLKYQNPTVEETIERLHFSNTQPLWATDNLAKGNRFIG